MSTSTGAGGGRGGGGRGGGGGGRGGGAAAAQSQSTASSSQSRSRHSARIIAQTNVDARLDAEFEVCGAEAFDYSRSVQDRVSTGGPDQQQREGVMAYLQHIQRGHLIQPFGCLLALDDKTLRVLAFSANAPDMLTDLPPAAVPSLDLNLNTACPAAQSDSNSPVLAFGLDARSLFTAPGAAALQKAALSPAGTDVSLLNPILVHCRSSGRPFYAILHRTTRCLIVDLEPVKPADLPMTAAAAGALQSYKLAAKAIARLQSLPGGGLRRLCDAVVEEVFELTGYDRVMTYRFHDDDHGEVFTEITKPGLDPYLGLHYPATDIPQAARFLFMKNRVRMICDCRAKPVAILQDDALGFEVSFCGSTLRAPHSCHLQYMENMNSIASLVMAVVINEPSSSDDSDETPGPGDQSQKKAKKLWGLLVCHNESPRFVPFPLRYACEFLAQVFAIHVNKELELDRQVREKNILRTQTLLCDMLLRKTGPISIVSGSPSIMDLVKCDGAALLYQNKVWRLGLAPAETQIQHIAHWLTEKHMDSTGLCTDSLLEAGYPGAASLGDMVCGMAAAQINSRDVLFWFRSHTAAEIRWGGAKHDSSQQDDGRKMHPRSSFKAFLEVVKMRSLPWNDYEMDAVHSLQLILRGTISNDLGKAATAGAGTAELESRIDELRLESMVELQAVTNEMVRLIETASVPILAVDGSGLVNGWNKKIAELTGLTVDEAIGKHMLSLVEEDSLPTVKKMLYWALQGKEEKNVQFQLKTHGQRREDGPVILIVNACSSRDINENVVGVCFVAQDMTGHKMVMDRFTRIEGDYKTIIQNPNPLIPPIFGADEFGWCSEWNAAMARLSGWPRDEVLDKMLLGEVFGGQLARCRMKNQDSFVSLSIIINNAMTGQEKEKVPFGFYTRNGKFAECLLSVSKKVDGEGRVTGVFCFLHVTSHELQRVMQVQQLTEQTALKRLKALAYIRQETRNPLSGMMYCRRMIQNAGLNEEQKKLIDMGSRCQRQLSRILDDLDLDSIMDSCLELEMVEFQLRDVITIAVSQVLLASQEKGVRVVYDDLNEEFMSEGLYGDGLRLQQIIADFLAVSVKFSPSGGLVELISTMLKQPVGQTLRLVKLEITIKHTHTQTGSGMAEELVSQMFGSGDDASEEGLGLLVCRKLLKLMNGDVRYLREASNSAFILSLELATAPPAAPKIYKPQPIRPFS